MSIRGLPPAAVRALANFTVQRAPVSFWAALADSSGQTSSAVLPALIASFPAPVLRCLEAATRVASTIWPPPSTACQGRRSGQACRDMHDREPHARPLAKNWVAFLRNTHVRLCWDFMQGKAEGLGTVLQIPDHSAAIALLVL